MIKRRVKESTKNPFGDRELKVKHPYAIKAVREYETIARGIDRAIDRIEANHLKEPYESPTTYDEADIIIITTPKEKLSQEMRLYLECRRFLTTKEISDRSALINKRITGG